MHYKDAGYRKVRRNTEGFILGRNWPGIHLAAYEHDDEHQIRESKAHLGETRHRWKDNIK
jgi:hypothetical protein